jgi:hypothetical protein
VSEKKDMLVLLLQFIYHDFANFIFVELLHRVEGANNTLKSNKTNLNLTTLKTLTRMILG